MTYEEEFQQFIEIQGPAFKDFKPVEGKLPNRANAKEIALNPVLNSMLVIEATDAYRTMLEPLLTHKGVVDKDTLEESTAVYTALPMNVELRIAKIVHMLDVLKKNDLTSSVSVEPKQVVIGQTLEH